MHKYNEIKYCQKIFRKTISIGAAFILNGRKRAIDIISFFMQTKINLLFL